MEKKTKVRKRKVEEREMKQKGREDEGKKQLSDNKIYLRVLSERK